MTWNSWLQLAPIKRSMIRQSGCRSCTDSNFARNLTLYTWGDLECNLSQQPCSMNIRVPVKSHLKLPASFRNKANIVKYCRLTELLALRHWTPQPDLDFWTTGYACKKSKNLFTNNKTMWKQTDLRDTISNLYGFRQKIGSTNPLSDVPEIVSRVRGYANNPMRQLEYPVSHSAFTSRNSWFD